MMNTVSRPLSFILPLTLLLASNSRAQAPIEIAWSNQTYGPDGPWHAVTVQIGTPPQSIDLFPGSPGTSNILSSDYCFRYRRPGCTATPNYFNQNTSQTYDDTWSQSIVGTKNVTGVPTWELPMSSSGAWNIATDMFTIPVQDGPALTSNASIQLTTDGELAVGSDGFSSLYTLGTLGLGGPVTGIAPTGASGPYIGNISVNYAFQNASRIPSASFALQVGSVVAGVRPSLHFGGYDRSRVVGRAISSIFRGNFAIVGVKDISMGSFWGPSPWNFDGNVQSGMLQTNVSGGAASNVTLDAYISPDQPFMVLPPETCNAIASHLPVSYDSSRELYMWDTSSTQYQTIVNGPHYLSFTLTDPGSTSAQTNSPSDIVIKVPFALLNLTLDPVIQQPGLPPRQYLPCYRYDRKDWGQWKLGRAFLQAAYLVGNWVPHAPHAETPVAGGWSLAQAPGPHASGPPDVRALQAWDYAVTSGYDGDDDDENDAALAGSWGFAQASVTLGPAATAQPGPSASASAAPGPLPSGAGVAPDSASSVRGGRLAPGATAGITIAIVGVLLSFVGAAYVSHRRRRAQRQQAALVANFPEAYAMEKLGVEVRETALLDSRTVFPEMPVRRDEAQELPGSGPAVPPKYDEVWTPK